MIGRLLSWLRPKPQPRSPWELSTPLLTWSKDDPWTIADSVCGTLILGATGSGKSSGSGRLIAESMLAAGFGGLVLTAKASEIDAWQSYARATNRAADIVVFGPREPWRFSFLEYEAKYAGEGVGLTENIVQLLLTAMEVAERGATSSGGNSDPYWRQSARQLLRNLVDLCLLSSGRVSVPQLYECIVSAPTNMEFLRSPEWRKNSACCRALAQAHARVTDADRKHDLEIVADFFLQTWARLAAKTRGIIESTVVGLLDVLNRGLLRTLFSTDTNLTPEVVEQRKVVVLALPVKEMGYVGQVAQVLFKTAFQRAIERRDVTKSPVPCFLWADEFQLFATSADAMFQATCRSSRVAVVALTQNRSVVEAALGAGQKGSAETTALFGNLNTKIFHCNSDPHTNEWAAQMIGRTRQAFANAGHSYDQADWTSTALGMSQPGQGSAGYSESYEFDLQPGSFSLLRTGGPDNGMLVDAVVFQNGRRFRATGKNWMHATFRQLP